MKGLVQIRTLECIGDLVELIGEDKRKFARFPVRFILVQDANDWDKLLIILQDRVDHVFRLSEYCADFDSLPDLSRLMDDIQAMGKGDALIIPLSEYLRLFGDNRGILKQLAQYSKSDGVIGGTKDRIYVPLYDVERIFREEMARVSRFGVQGEGPECFEIKTNLGDYPIQLRITNGSLQGLQMSYPKAAGLKAFFQLCEKKAPQNLWLVTQFSDYICESTGTYDIDVYSSIFQLVKQELPGTDILQEEWGDDEQWGWLYSVRKEGEAIEHVIAREFNVARLDLYDILLRWSDYDEKRRWLAWLACKIKRPSGYIKYVMGKESARFDSFVNDMILTIIDVVKDNRLEDEEIADIIRQRKQLLERMPITNLPPEFRDRLDELPNDIGKLKCLAGILYEEKCMIVETVSKLIISGESNEWPDILHIIYPELYYYLNNVDYGKELATAYFSKYKRAKVCNEVTEDIRCMAREIKDEGLLWQYKTRYEFLQKLSEPYIVYWADGVGAEWLGLIEGLLKHEGFGNDMECDYEYSVTRANLPTTTENNKDWQYMTADYREYKDYDILIHSYNCRYPEYLIDEFERIGELVRSAVSLLSISEVVVITADHGTSRLAAIDKQPSVEAPEGLVRDYGRYCQNDGSLNIEEYPSCIEDNGKIMFADYNRFKSSGHVPGEIHGGATLEEALVPVIVLRRSRVKGDIEFTLLSNVIPLSVKGEAKLVINVEGYVEKLTMLVDNKNFIFESVGNGHWETNVKGLKSGDYRATLFGDGKNLGNFRFTLTRGLTENDLGLRG